MECSQEIKRPKYNLIVSQYYDSRHMFVINAEMEDALFYDKARKTIEALENYKRNEGVTMALTFGDMQEKYYAGTSRRYNVNDHGDIYFIPCWSIAQAFYEAKPYWADSYRNRGMFVKKKVIQQIRDHHNEEIIKKIISKYFEVL